MVKYTPAYLKKLEDLLKEGDYEVRYEKGNFKSGYCILEAKRVVVINKFSTLESRIQALVEIIQAMSASGHLSADLKQAGLKKPIRDNSENDQSEEEFSIPEQSEDSGELPSEHIESDDNNENSEQQSLPDNTETNSDN